MDANEVEIHRKFAVECFNRTWDLIDKADRSQKEDLKMVHTAHASRYHWGEIGTPLEFARGDWQISRVYAILGDGAPARKYAKESLQHCLKNNIKDFDLAFAYEALARASFLLQDEDGYQQYFALAGEAAEGIKQKDNRDYFLTELNSIK